MTPLPDYFFADLPPGTTLSPLMLREACDTLKRNREQFLASRSTPQMIRLLADVAEGWLEPGNRFRRLALEQGPAATGFGRATLERGINDFFRQLTRANLRALLNQDLGGVDRLDTLPNVPGESGSALACGPEFLVHICAGTLPNPAWMNLVLGLLTRSAQLMKCARGTSLLPRLFAHSLYEADPKLGACVEVAEWRGGDLPLEEVLFAAADCVTATGSDETLAAIRARLPVTTRFVGYGHRVSFGFVASEAFAEFGGRKLVAAAANDVVAWNQLGCLSPHVFYVQRGGELAPEQFAQALAAELERRESSEPRGSVPAEVAATIASRRAIYEVRAAHSSDTLLWCSPNSTGWTVVWEADPRWQTSCLHRFIYVKAVADLSEALQGADFVRQHLSTVGLAAAPEQARELATQLARWGATRICPPGQMQNPPLTWRHDGRPALGDLVTWADWER